MPEQNNHEENGSQEMGHFEQLIVQVPTYRHSHSPRRSNLRNLPDGTMGHECKPCLENDSNDTSPVEQQTPCEVSLHIVPMNVVHNEWERVQERKDQEGI